MIDSTIILREPSGGKCYIYAPGVRPDVHAAACRDSGFSASQRFCR